MTAVLEFDTGAALLAAPSLVGKSLLGVSLAAPAPLVVARLTGAALVALGVACWFARGDASSRIGPRASGAAGIGSESRSSGWAGGEPIS